MPLISLSNRTCSLWNTALQLGVRGVNGVTVRVCVQACSLKITELGCFRAQVADRGVCGGRLMLIAGMSACV